MFHCVQIFSGLSGEYGGNYGAPSGFNWDGDNEPVELNENLSTYNAPARVADFIAQALSQAKETRGEHIMWTMGSDFTYEGSEQWFHSMDNLITVTSHALCAGSFPPCV